LDAAGAAGDAQRTNGRSFAQTRPSLYFMGINVNVMEEKSAKQAGPLR